MLRIVVASLVLGALAACSCDPTGVRTGTFACASDEDCAEGNACVGGVCASTAVDAGGDAGTDAGVDGGADAGVDGGADAGDAGSGDDAGSDGGADAGLDGGAWPDHLRFLNLPATPRPGACLGPITVSGELADGGAAVADRPWPISLAAAPAGLAYFSGGGCAGSATSQVMVAPGSSGVVVSLRTPSGQRYQLTADLAGAASAMGVLDIPPVVRRGGCALDAGSVTVVCAITPPQESMGSTALFTQIGTSTADPASAEVACRLSSISTIDCMRQLGNGDAVIAWQTLELPDLAVQHLAAPADAGDLVFPVAGVDRTQAFTLLSLANAGNIYDHNDQAAILLGPNALTLRFQDGGAGNGVAYAQVVELPGLSVTRAQSSVAIGEAQVVVNGPSVNLPSTFVLAGWSNALTGGNAPPCDRLLRAELTTDKAVTLTRGNGTACTDLLLPDVSVERVDLGQRGTVLAVTAALDAGQTSGASQLARAFDSTRTLVFATGQAGGTGQALGETDLATPTDDIPGDVSFLFGLDGGTPTSATTLTFRRSSALGNARVSGFVVEWSP